MRRYLRTAILALLLPTGCYHAYFIPGTPETPPQPPTPAHWDKADATRGGTDAEDDDYICQKETAKTSEYGGSAPSLTMCMKHRGWARVEAAPGSPGVPGTPAVSGETLDVKKTTTVCVVVGAVTVAVGLIVTGAAVYASDSSHCTDAFNCPRP